ncbi:MAG: hypothetical protein H6839_09720 [Planctomycetes bacterium]|nr:hypothetical protein [Planctomycetota bacterium]
MAEAAESKFYLKLSVENRLKLVGEIMESILAGDDPASVRGPTWEALERRAAEPEQALSWREFCRELGWSE